MEDAVRPGEQAARRMYARGYQTWFALFETACKETYLPRDCLQRLRTAFPNQPRFPDNIDVDISFTNVALAKGTNTWLPAEEPGHLPPFQDEVVFHVAWDKPTRVILTADIRNSMPALPGIFGRHSNHIPILLQAWAYILSARWAELIPGARISQQDASRSDGDPNGPLPMEVNQAAVTINIGAVSGDAARWWTAILSVEGGWDATIRNRKGELLHSPWSTIIVPDRPLIISAEIKTAASTPNITPTSLTAACRYLADYCSFHGIDDDLSQAALAAVLLIPTAKYDGRPIALPIPEIAWDGDREEGKPPTASNFATLDQVQLDKLLTLSCNARGTKALLTSVFFELDVASNICGMWLRGSFAFLDTIKDPHSLLRTLMKRDPEIGFLWLGAFITGTYHRTLGEGRTAWWNIDLGAAAWTGTLMSFIQAPVPRLGPGTSSISRADESRLLFLCHGINYTIPPLFPFPPFGSVALDDTNLDVHEHSLCGRDHSLRYAGLTWRCNDGTEDKQGPEVPAVAIRPKSGQLSNHGSQVHVDYDGYDSEEENSEMVTRNIFTWLRGEDGFPVAEKAIRKHEWIDNLDSDDDAPIEGDVHSSVGGRLHGWLLKTSTQRSNSI
ncbi:hypothetical protein FZEAL_7397 [Fusarium zealandicum]|uniref:Uncharacterized protein n=1 Tax=Fusarium zealandicum TaxID=1053134 RepID=A0A8H4XII4_9HYPO|nr:hypothetical protein FZEAL_7397 [Fusarium zealandicum]